MLVLAVTHVKADNEESDAVLRVSAAITYNTQLCCQKALAAGYYFSFTSQVRMHSHSFFLCEVKHSAQDWGQVLPLWSQRTKIPIRVLHVKLLAMLPQVTDLQKSL